MAVTLDIGNGKTLTYCTEEPSTLTSWLKVPEWDIWYFISEPQSESTTIMLDIAEPPEISP